MSTVKPLNSTGPDCMNCIFRQKVGADNKLSHCENDDATVRVGRIEGEWPYEYNAQDVIECDGYTPKKKLGAKVGKTYPKVLIPQES